MKPKNKIKMKRYFITMLAVLTLIFCSAGCGGCAGCSKKTAREALEDAYTKTFVKNHPVESLVGLKELTSKQQENQAYSSGLSLTLQELSGEDLEEYSAFSGLGFSMNTASDLANRKASGSFDVNYGGSTYITLGGQMQGSKFYLTVPQLLDGSITLDLSTLKEDLASDSLFAKSFRESGLTLPEDFSADMFDSLGALSSLEGLGKITSALDDFSKDLLVEVADKEAVTLPDEIEANSLYTVTITKDSYKSLAKTTLEAILDNMQDSANAVVEALGESATDVDMSEIDMTEINASLDELAEAVGDVVLTVAVNKDGYITYATSEVATETETFTLTAKFLGEKNPVTESLITFDATVDGETLTFSYQDSFDTETNGLSLTAGFTADGETLLSVACEGSLSDIEKGKKYTLDMDYLEFKLADALSVSLAGSYYIDTTKCDITAPTGTEYGLLTMTENDLTALVLEVLANIQKDPLLSELMNYIDLGI